VWIDAPVSGWAPIQTSARGELEITDINLKYLNPKYLDAKKLLGRGFAWLDTPRANRFWKPASS
jgi:dTDP-glucose pyrophosphorylase